MQDGWRETKQVDGECARELNSQSFGVLSNISTLIATSKKRVEVHKGKVRSSKEEFWKKKEMDKSCYGCS